MSGAPELERSVLERKERNELHVIAESLGLKPGSRTKKADLVDQILRATGVDVASEPSPNGVKGSEQTNGAPEGTVSLVSQGTSNGGAHAEPATSATSSTAESADVAASASASEGQSASPAEGHNRESRDNRGRDSVGGAQGGALGGAQGGAQGGGHGGGQRIGAGQQAQQGQQGQQAQQGQQGQQAQQGQQGQQAQQGQQGQQAQQGHQGQRQGGQRSDWGQRGNIVGEAEPGNRSRRRRRGRDRGIDRELQNLERTVDQPFHGELVDVEGFLDVRDEGFGFLRTSGFVASAKDVYVAAAQVRKFGLRRGDYIVGASRPASPTEKFPALLRIDTVSGLTPDEARQRPRFEDLTPLFPDQKLHMETPGDPANVTARIVDLLSPIGKGQRGLIVSPPKAGKTTVIKQIAHSIETNNPEVHLIVLLVDERPEEVTDMRRTVKGEVIASTFDRPAEEHTMVAELALERAKRLVEVGRDVVIILDGITRLTRAYNLSAPASGRLTSGGIDQAAIYPPKKFFGAARNAEEGGSLTILATALVETGSKADDVIFEELKGTGNMELRLDRRLAERRLYPAIDVNASSTRHEELLFERGQLQLVWRLRRVLNGLSDDGTSWKALELLMDKIKTTKSNDEFLAEVSKTQTPV
jgi:transcription termination factor Rho